MSEEYWEGFDAYSKNIDPQDCPYLDGTFAFEDWMYGYEDSVLKG